MRQLYSDLVLSGNSDAMQRVIRSAQIRSAESWEQLSEKLTESHIPFLLKVANNVSSIPTDIFKKYRFIVTPDPSFEAFATIHEGMPYVVVAEGLFEVISYNIEIELIGQYPFFLDSISDERRLIYYQWLMKPGKALLQRRLIEPCLLPNLREYFTEEMGRLEMTLLCMTELFVILHEIGHLELRHFALTENEKHSFWDGADNEGYDKEYAADQFAFEYLVKPGEEIDSGAMAIYDFFKVQKIFEENAAGQLSSHPPAKQRMEKLKAFFFKHGKEFKGPVGLTDELDDMNPPIEDKSYEKHSTEDLIDELRWVAEKIFEEVDPTFVPKKVLEIKSRSDEASELEWYMFEGRQIRSSSLGKLAETYLSNCHDHKSRNEFITQHAEMLTDAVDLVLRSLCIENNDDKKLKRLLNEERRFLRQCREVGIENASPVNDVLAQLLIANTTTEKCNILKHNTYVLSKEVIEKLDDLREKLVSIHELEELASIDSLITLLSYAIEAGIEEGCRKYSQRPVFPENVQMLATELLSAETGRNVNDKINACNEALALLTKIDETPIWGLVFQSHLSELPGGELSRYRRE